MKVYFAKCATVKWKPTNTRLHSEFTARQSSLLGGDGFILKFCPLRPGSSMVKVTFNSALAQKELKKGEKDEALIPQEGVSWAKFTKARVTVFFFT